MKWKFGALAVVLALLAGSSSFASLIDVGDPEDGDSWRQQFNEKGLEFDYLQVIMVSSGDAFEANKNYGVFSAFQTYDFTTTTWITASGWAQTYPTGSYTTATPFPVGAAAGPDVTDLTKGMRFKVQFSGAKADNPLTFNLQTWHNGVNVENEDAIWSYSDVKGKYVWSYVPGTLPAQQIPEPTSLLVWSVIGAAGVGAVLLRRSRARRSNP